MDLSKAFGVERGEKFGIKKYNGVFEIVADNDGVEFLISVASGLRIPITIGELYKIIAGAPDNIIHFSTSITDREKDQLRALFEGGYRWLVKDKCGDVCAFSECPFSEMPVKGDGFWYAKGACAFINPNIDIGSLVSWEDAGPLDISRTLQIKNNFAKEDI